MPQGDKLESLFDYNSEMPKLGMYIDELGRLKQTIIEVNNVTNKYKNASTFQENIAATKELVVASEKIVEVDKKLIDLKSKMTAELRKEEQLKQQILKTQKEEAALKAADEKLNQQVIKTLKEEIAYEQALDKAKKSKMTAIAAEAKLAEQATNEYFQLNKALADSELRYKNLALTIGFEADATKEALDETLKIRSILDKVDGNLRNYGRNVGNYKSAFDGLGMSFTQVARELPSLAINTQTFLLAISNNLPMVFDELRKARVEMAEMKAQGQEVPGMFSKVASSLFSLQVGLSVAVTLFTVFGGKIIESISSLFQFKDANEEAAKAVDKLIKAQVELIRLQKDMDATFRDPISGLDRLEKELQIAEALGKSRKETLQIERQIAEQQAAQANNEFYKKQENGLAGFAAFKDYQQKLFDAQVKLSAAIRTRSESNADDLTKDGKAELELLDKRVERAKTLVDFYKERLDTQRVIINENFKANTKLAVIDAEIEAEKKGKKAMKSTKDSLDAEFEIYKINQTRKIKLLEEYASMTDLSGEERIELARKWEEASFDLIKRQTEKEVDALKEKEATLRENLKNAKAEERNNILIEIDNTNAAILIAQAKSDDDVIKLHQDFEKKVTQITKEETDKRKKVYEETVSAIKRVLQEQSSAIEADKTLRLAGLEKAYADGLIKEKDYQKEKSKIISEAAILNLKVQRAALQKEYDEKKKQGEDDIELQNKIAKLTGEIQLAESEGKGKDKKAEKDALNAQIEKDAFLAYDVATELVRRRYELELNYLQELIDKNNEYKEMQVKNINASTLSAQEKAAQLIMLDNEVDANNKKLQRQQRDIKIREAKFDRDVQILKIAGETAIAAAKAGWVTPLALAIEAAGALQIGLLLAKPIPAYEKGTDNAVGGPSLVSEKGRELVIEPSGEAYFTPDEPSIIDIKKHSRVIPHNELNQMMYASMIINTAQNIPDDSKKLDEIKDAILYGSRMQINAFKKAQPVINIHNNADFRAYIKGKM